MKHSKLLLRIWRSQKATGIETSSSSGGSRSTGVRNCLVQGIYKFLRTVGTTFGFLAVPITFFDLVGHPASVIGTSMEPTLNGTGRRWWTRDIVWLSHFHVTEPQVGQIYVFRPPNDADDLHIKRVSGIEGQVIRPKSGPPIVEIPQGSCWMESDNRHRPYDSSVYGPVCCALLTGRATHVIWPPRRWHKIKIELLEDNTVPNVVDLLFGRGLKTVPV